MPTTVVKTIGSGGDYSTLALWEAGAPANLVTSDQIWEGRLISAATELSGTGNLLTVAGSTVDATRFKRLTTASGASFRDHASVQTNPLRADPAKGACITVTDSSYSHAIEVQENYFQLSKLQVRGTGATSVSIAFVSDGFTGVVVDSCILEGRGAGTAVNCGVWFDGTNNIIKNTLVIQRASAASYIAFLGSTSAYNCTFVVPSDLTAATEGVHWSYTSGQTFRNCAVFGATTCLTGSGTVQTCKTDQASPPSGFTQATYNTTQFVATTDAARDYRIPTGSALKDAGTTDSTNAATDIVGTSRPQGSAYDVGAWELVQSSSSIAPRAMAHYRRRRAA